MVTSYSDNKEKTADFITAKLNCDNLIIEQKSCLIRVSERMKDFLAKPFQVNLPQRHSVSIECETPPEVKDDHG